jgi:hypothetical protein
MVLELEGGEPLVLELLPGVGPRGLAGGVTEGEVDAAISAAIGPVGVDLVLIFENGLI